MACTALGGWKAASLSRRSSERRRAAVLPRPLDYIRLAPECYLFFLAFLTVFFLAAAFVFFFFFLTMFSLLRLVGLKVLKAGLCDIAQHNTIVPQNKENEKHFCGFSSKIFAGGDLEFFHLSRRCACAIMRAETRT
jgi:hypothetical protein